MMINRFLLLALFAIPMNCFTNEIEEPLKVTLCDVAKNPQLYDGKIIEINASQARLKKNEWGLDGDICLPVFLLVFPEDIIPSPQFILEESPVLSELLASRNERVAFRADFVGRFDWSGNDKKKLFGRSKQSMRLVLQSVSNPMKIIIPYK